MLLWNELELNAYFAGNGNVFDLFLTREDFGALQSSGI